MKLNVLTVLSIVLDAPVTASLIVTTPGSTSMYVSDDSTTMSNAIHRALAVDGDEIDGATQKTEEEAHAFEEEINDLVATGFIRDKAIEYLNEKKKSDFTRLKKQKLDHEFGPQYDRETVNCDNCCICYNAMKPSRNAKRGQPDALASIECNHQFHEVCLTSWMGVKPVCPLCNMETSKYDTDATRAERAGRAVKAERANAPGFFDFILFFLNVVLTIVFLYLYICFELLPMLWD